MGRKTTFSLLDHEYHGSVIRAATENVNYGRPDEVPARVILLWINRPVLHWIIFQAMASNAPERFRHCLINFSGASQYLPPQSELSEGEKPADARFRLLCGNPHT